MRAVWPENLPLTARLGVKDFAEGEQPFEESVELIRQFKERGLDLIDVTLGFNGFRGTVPWGEEGFMVPSAEKIKQDIGLLTATSWNIRDPKLADALISSAKVDLIMIGRSFLADPYWPYHAAAALNKDEPQSILPLQYAAWLHGHEAPLASRDTT